MSTRLEPILQRTTAEADDITPRAGQIVVEKVTGRIRTGDGVTPGGIKHALVSDTATALTMTCPDDGTSHQVTIRKVQGYYILDVAQ